MVGKREKATSMGTELNFADSQSTRSLTHDAMDRLPAKAPTRAAAVVYQGVSPFTLKKGESNIQAIHLDRSGKMVIPDEDNCDYYTLYYHLNPDVEVLVYTETYSNFNATTEPNPYTYTSKYTNSVSEGYEGQVGQDFPGIFSWQFSFTFESTVTCEMDVSATATASPGQWLTGYYGAWSERRDNCIGTHTTCDGNTVTVASGFSILTPTGATGWYFDNSAP